MSIANPLTASTDIQKANFTVNSISDNSSVSSSTKTSNSFGEFSQDIVSISRLGREKQQAEQVIGASGTTSNSAAANSANKNSADQKEVKSDDSVEVSSSIGRSQSVGNLTRDRASALYNAIAALL